MNSIFRGIKSFSLIGIAITSLSLSTNVLLLGYFETPLIPTYVFVYLTTLSLSFYLNTTYTFKSKMSIRNMTYYFLVYLSGMCIGVLLLNIWTKLVTLEDWIYPFLVLPFTLIWNFLMSKKLLR